MTAMSLTLSIWLSQRIGTTTVDQVMDTTDVTLQSLQSISQSTLCTYLFTIRCTCPCTTQVVAARVLGTTPHPHPPPRVIAKAIQAARAKRKRGARGERKAARSASAVAKARVAARVAASVEEAAEARQEANASMVGVGHHLRTVTTGTVM